MFIFNQQTIRDFAHSLVNGGIPESDKN